MYSLEHRLERESSPEEKRHEAYRVALTYTILNVVSIVMIHMIIAPVLSPHEFEAVVLNSRTGMVAFKAFCGFWTVVTAFYNFMLGVHGFAWMLKKWEREEAEGHWNRYRDPRCESEVGEEEYDDGEKYRGSGSSAWFANNNPYTAARRTHSGNFVATRRSKRLSHPMERYRIHTEHEPIMEETGDEEPEATAEKWRAREEGNMRFSNMNTENGNGPYSISRPADAYPFSKREIDVAGSSTTTWSNSATSAGELARKRRADKANKKKDREEECTKLAQIEVKAHNEASCASPTYETAKPRTTGPSSTSVYSCERDKAPGKSANQEAHTSGGEGSSKTSTHQSEASREPTSSIADGDATNEISESERQPENKRRQRSTSEASYHSEQEEFDYDPLRERTRAMKNIITHGSYHNQQAALRGMNQAIWSEVGDHMERQLRIQLPPPIEPSQRKEKNKHEKKRRWWSLRKKETSQGIEMIDFKKGAEKPYKDSEGSKQRMQRRQILAGIVVVAAIMTALPPFMAIGGDIISHEYQFHHACDNFRWDIKLDSSGLYPEQDNNYNRAIFKDRRGKGYEKEFMMNLEGMSTYGTGLDQSLVNKRRGYVFYLSDRDLTHQPDRGENVKFPYPVVVAYDMLKHAYYAHDDIWRDLNNEAFFDNGAFMNGTLSIFPSEGIWLEKKEKDGYCGQPKRVLKNAYDQRIIWTVIDDRKDCTVLRVCASNKATRRQVVIATGMILLRLTMSATCCSKGPGEAEPYGT
ncbi:hypothetical protein ABW20_dc0107235 [Dactylellina cionopaga]|nr:hypothetical protein ABW20_dc0107235 [Dactylellina cionopaga]